MTLGLLIDAHSEEIVQILHWLTISNTGAKDITEISVYDSMYQSIIWLVKNTTQLSKNLYRDDFLIAVDLLKKQRSIKYVQVH